MTEHDRIRKERAEQCDKNDIDELSDVIRGLQSTDDPLLVPLHDLLMRRLTKLKRRAERLTDQVARGVGDDQ